MDKMGYIKRCFEEEETPERSMHDKAMHLMKMNFWKTKCTSRY